MTIIGKISHLHRYIYHEVEIEPNLGTNSVKKTGKCFDGFMKRFRLKLKFSKGHLKIYFRHKFSKISIQEFFPYTIIVLQLSKISKPDIPKTRNRFFSKFSADSLYYAKVSQRSEKYFEALFLKSVSVIISRVIVFIFIFKIIFFTLYKNDLLFPAPGSVNKVNSG